MLSQHQATHDHTTLHKPHIGKARIAEGYSRFKSFNSCTAPQVELEVFEVYPVYKPYST